MTTKKLKDEISEAIKIFNKENECVIKHIDIELKIMYNGMGVVKESYVDSVTIEV